MKMMIEALLCVLLSDSGKPSDPDAVAMWIDDLGRLTPFGRTFDVYIQTGFDPEFSKPDGSPRPPYRIGSTRGNESPSRSFGWSIEGPVLRNRNEAFYPFYDNCQECIEYDQAQVTFGEWVLPDGTVLSCQEAGVGWDCFQANPYQTFGYLGAKFTPVNWIFQGPEGCCPTLGPITDLEYFWCDSWILHGQPGKTYGENGKQAYPRVQQRYKDLIDSPVLKFWLPTPVGQAEGQQCCQSVPQNDNAELITWSNFKFDWESKKHPGSFHIARFTGPDYFASGGVIRWACGQGYPCDPTPYSVNYYPDNSCPSDLNEDGLVGFEDLLQVLADVSAFKYHPQTNNGFNAIIKVLSEWGACP